MASFKLYATVNSPLAHIITAALGVSANTTLGSVDAGKTLKLAAGDKYVPCEEGDHFDGVLVAVDSGPTVNEGFNIGSVQLNREIEAVVGVGGTTVAVGDFVVAGAPLAVGTAGKPQVSKQALPSDLSEALAAYGKPLWKVMSILKGTGAAGSTVLIGKA